MVDIHTLSTAEFDALPLVSEGNSKIIKDAGDGLVVIALKPTVYSFTHHRAGEIPGSDSLRLRACRIFHRLLREHDIPTAYLEVGERYILARHVPSPPPIEVIVKAYHVGTPKHRYYGMHGMHVRADHPTLAGAPIRAGEAYPEVFVRFDWRNPARHPRTQQRLADEVLPEAQADWFIDTAAARQTAQRAFSVLSTFLRTRQIVLRDICLFITSDGRTLYGEISQDCARFHHATMNALDKDVWRAGGSSDEILEKWTRLLELIG